MGGKPPKFAAPEKTQKLLHNVHSACHVFTNSAYFKSIIILCSSISIFLDEIVTQHQDIHLARAKSPKGLLRGVDDRFSSQAERRIEDNRHTRLFHHDGLGAGNLHAFRMITRLRSLRSLRHQRESLERSYPHRKRSTGIAQMDIFRALG